MDLAQSLKEARLLFFVGKGLLTCCNLKMFVSVCLNGQPFLDTGGPPCKRELLLFCFLDQQSNRDCVELCPYTFSHFPNSNTGYFKSQSFISNLCNVWHSVPPCTCPPFGAQCLYLPHLVYYFTLQGSCLHCVQYPRHCGKQSTDTVQALPAYPIWTLLFLWRVFGQMLDSGQLWFLFWIQLSFAVVATLTYVDTKERWFDWIKSKDYLGFPMLCKNCDPDTWWSAESFLRANKREQGSVSQKLVLSFFGIVYFIVTYSLAWARSLKDLFKAGLSLRHILYALLKIYGRFLLSCKKSEHELSFYGPSWRNNKLPRSEVFCTKIYQFLTESLSFSFHM